MRPVEVFSAIITRKHFCAKKLLCSFSDRVMSERYRNFVLTLWLHMTERCWEEILAEMVETGVLRFVAYGEEVCPDTGTLHYQAYAAFLHAKSKRSVEKLFPNSFVEPMYGSLRQSEVYCSKEGSFHKLGDEPKQGERFDLLGVKDEIDAGEHDVMVIAEKDKHFETVMRNERALTKYAHHVRGNIIKKDRTMPKVYIRVGDSGSGKTRWLDEHFGIGNWARMPNPTSSWFITPAVSAATTVLIDDVGPKKVPKVEEFLEWTDRYPIEFNSKGGHLWWKPQNIVFTSNVAPSDWWPDLTEHHKEAIERRIHKLVLVFKDRPEEVLINNG